MLLTTIKSVNTILYCGKWDETVRFYRDLLGLPVAFFSDWFVEFLRDPEGNRLEIWQRLRGGYQTEPQVVEA